MPGTPTKHFVILVLMGIILLLVGGAVLNHMTRFNPSQWLRYNYDLAQPYADSLLRGEDVPAPDAFTDYKIERGKDWVSFGRLVGPFYSYGMIYSPAGYKPEHGLGGEPVIIKWRHIRDDWYHWVAD